MISKYARVDFARCSPKVCDGEQGLCLAVPSCPRDLLEQEDVFDAPILMSPTMCVGCGDCVRACPLEAIAIDRA